VLGQRDSYIRRVTARRCAVPPTSLTMAGAAAIANPAKAAGPVIAESTNVGFASFGP
jgi:hypothetical protein